MTDGVNVAYHRHTVEQLAYQTKRAGEMQDELQMSEARLRALRGVVGRFMSTVRWDVHRTDTHVEVPLALVQQFQDDLLAHAVAQATGAPPPSVICDFFREWTGAPDVCRRCMCLRSDHRA